MLCLRVVDIRGRGNQRLLVRENEYVATFCVLTEVCDAKIGRRQLSTKGAARRLGRLQGFREKGEWLSVVTFFLVEGGANLS